MKLDSYDNIELCLSTGNVCLYQCVNIHIFPANLTGYSSGVHMCCIEGILAMSFNNFFHLKLANECKFGHKSPHSQSVLKAHTRVPP